MTQDALKPEMPDEIDVVRDTVNNASVLVCAEHHSNRALWGWTKHTRADRLSGVTPDDAQKWRALMSSARITCMGSAGFSEKEIIKNGPHEYRGQPYRHLTLNFWTHGEGGDEQDKRGREMLESYVSTIRGQAPATGDGMNLPPIPDGMTYFSVRYMWKDGSGNPVWRAQISSPGIAAEDNGPSPCAACEAAIAAIAAIKGETHG